MPKRQAEKPGFLSEEFVNESDDSDGEKANGATLTANETHTDSESNGSDDGDLDTANETKEAKSRSATSVESDADSVEGSESETEQSSKSSDSEPEDDRSGKDEDVQINADSEDSNTSKDSRKRGHDDAINGRSEQSKRQKTNSEGLATSISKQPASSQNLDSLKSDITRRNADSEGPTKIIGKEFSPPQGFNPLTLGASDFASENAEVFSNLDSKQIWHISAPSSLNIESIKSIDLEAASKGETILMNGGISYTMQESSAQYETLMLVDGISARYKPSRTKLAKSFKLGIKSNNEKNPSSQDGDHQSPKKSASRFVAQNPGEKKAARTQPGRLHMQYQPFGSETVKRRAVVEISSASVSNIRGPINTSPSTKSARQSHVIADPLLDAIASSKAFPTYTPKPVIFSTPDANNEDVEMKDAPSPSKRVDGSKTVSCSKTSQKAKVNGTALESSRQPKAKKKKSKLVDEGSL